LTQPSHNVYAEASHRRRASKIALQNRQGGARVKAVKWKLAVSDVILEALERCPWFRWDVMVLKERVLCGRDVQLC